MKENVLNFFTQGDERSLNVKKNIALMILVKGGSILLSLLLVPLTLNYVDNECYGVWLTLSSMVVWISFFDIGINNGLRNRLTEALAHNDYELGRKYVSTTYAILFLIFIPLMCLLLLVAPFVNWYSLLNINQGNVEGLLIAICIVIAYFCINFIFSTINIVTLAVQKPAISSMITLVQQLVSLTIIYILTLTTKGSLVYLCLALCVAPLVVILGANMVLYKKRYQEIAPTFKSVDFSVSSDLMKLGIQFFIIQTACIVQCQLINFLIIRYYGAAEVTSYNISYKYFSVLTMVWTIIITPLWAAVSDATVKQDYAWVKNAERKYLKLFMLFVLGGAFMFFISSYVYDLWVGSKVVITSILSFWVFIYCLVSMFSGIYVTILNGMGLLKVQMYACFFSPFVFLGLCYIFINMGLGVHGFLIAMIISSFNGYLLAPVQYILHMKSL
ncbi:lipopolysaccharide biosynthesis protein [Bacteroides helcogenes]|nr:MATE family efflux transporter [Bacteroides helcogenes]MDY5238381.1 MATE family efflux transporter [Bacteroides helcogenes]